jgi:hypothetical protein
MNNEKYENIIKQVWKEYGLSHWYPPTNPNGKLLSDQLWGLKPMQHSKESFIIELKTNPKFAEKWGLKIEERELSLKERCDEYIKTHPIETNDGVLNYKWVGDNLCTHEDYNGWNIPTKLITITYNNETIEVYE